MNDWLSFITMSNRHWRGDIKYSIQFLCPPFYSARVKVFTTQQNSVGVVDSGDLPSKIVDIKGDTWIDFTVPFMHLTHWRSPISEAYGPYYYGPTLTIQLESPIYGSSLPATPVLYVNVFRAGGENTQFTALRGVRSNVYADRKFTSNCSLNEHFSKPFPGLIDGVSTTTELGDVAVEQTNTISDCLKRTNNWIPDTSLTAHPGAFPAGTSNANWYTLGGEPFNYFASCFRYWKGGRIIGHTQACQLVGMNFGSGSPTWGDGVAPWFTTSSNVFYNNEKVHLHYVAPTPYYPMTFGPGQSFFSPMIGDPVMSYAPLGLTGVSNSQTSLTICGADDLMYLQPIPFFSLDFAPIDFGPWAEFKSRDRQRLSSSIPYPGKKAGC